MLTGLDPHSGYMNAEEFREMQEDTAGKFAGLGMEVIQENGFIKVISPIDDTPASRAGIRAGDIITGTERHDRAGTVDGGCARTDAWGTNHKDYTDDQARRRR